MIIIGCDHGGFVLKEKIKERLLQNKYEITDCGIHELHEVDYPLIAFDVCKKVLESDSNTGILICGTGIGMSIAANKIHNIRAAVCSDCFSAKMAREHNDANIITIGERVIGEELAWMIIKTFLESKFSGGKHQPRVRQITELENKSFL